MILSIIFAVLFIVLAVIFLTGKGDMLNSYLLFYNCHHYLCHPR